jgi:hypothetical protein
MSTQLGNWNVKAKEGRREGGGEMPSAWRGQLSGHYKKSLLSHVRLYCTLIVQEALAPGLIFGRW